MPAEYRAYVPPRRPEVVVEQRATAQEPEAPDYCLSGENPLHHRVNALNRTLLQQVYDDTLPRAMQESAKALGRLTEQLLFQTEDTYDQSHRTRKAVAPSPEHLARLSERWHHAANEAKNFVALAITTDDIAIVRNATQYAEVIQEIAKKVQGTVPGSASEQPAA